MADTKWKGRTRKTQQDKTPNTGSRVRVQEWDRRLAFMQNHKPRRSADWLAFRKMK